MTLRSTESVDSETVPHLWDSGFFFFLKGEFLPIGILVKGDTQHARPFIQRNGREPFCCLAKQQSYTTHRLNRHLATSGTSLIRIFWKEDPHLLCYSHNFTGCPKKHANFLIFFFQIAMPISREFTERGDITKKNLFFNQIRAFAAAASGGGAGMGRMLLLCLLTPTPPFDASPKNERKTRAA